MSISQDDIARSAVTAAEQAGSSGTTPDEFAMMLAQAHYLYIDDDVKDMILKDDRIKKLLPALSHLIRTSRLDEPKVIEEMKIRWRRALRLKLLVLGGKADVRSMAEFDALVNFGYSVIQDAKNGWRGKLVTERIRTYKIEGQGEKRKKFLGLF